MWNGKKTKEVKCKRIEVQERKDKRRRKSPQQNAKSQKRTSKNSKQGKRRGAKRKYKKRSKQPSIVMNKTAGNINSIYKSTKKNWKTKNQNQTNEKRKEKKMCWLMGSKLFSFVYVQKRKRKCKRDRPITQHKQKRANLTILSSKTRINFKSQINHFSTRKKAM